MRASAKLLIAAALALGTSAPAAAVQDYNVEPSATLAIVAATQECRAAMTTQRVDEQRLVAGGWSRITFERPAREDQMHEFRREQLIIWLPQVDSSCIVMARVRDTAHYDEVIQALTGAFGNPAERRGNGSTLWLEDSGAGLRADKSGSHERLGIRIFILPADTPGAGPSK